MWSFPLRGHRPKWPYAARREAGAAIAVEPREIVLVLCSASKDGKDLPRSLALSFASPDGVIVVQASIADPRQLSEDVSDAVHWLETGEQRAKIESRLG